MTAKKKCWINIVDDAWKQSALTISLLGISVRKSKEQYKGVLVGSIIFLVELFNKITSRHTSEIEIFIDTPASGTVQFTFEHAKVESGSIK